MFWILKSLSPETARTAVRQGPMCGLMTAMGEETKSGPSTQAFDLDFTKYFDFIEHSLFTSTLSLFYEFGSKKFNRLSTDSKKYSKCKLCLRLNIQRISAESLGLNLHIFGIKLYNMKRFPYWQPFPTKSLEKYSSFVLRWWWEKNKLIDANVL